MPDSITTSAVNATQQPQNIRDIAAAWLEVHDIQRKVSEDYQKNNTALSKMLNLTKSVQTGVFDNIKKEFTLKAGLKNLDKGIADLQEKSHGITDAATRQQAKVSMESMLQRKLAWEKELALVSKINKAGLAILVKFLSETYELFKLLDKSAANFRMTMGFTRDTAKELRATAQRIAIDFMHVGVTIDGAYNAIAALTNEIGSAHVVSLQLVKTTAVLKSQLGVSEEASAGFLKNMAAIAGTSMEAQQSMAYMAGAMSNAVGVPLNAVMKDIATKSSTTLTMMSRFPKEVVKAAVELRRMGTDLDRASKSSSELLNFTQNIQDEMEASVLLGHSINLQKARELAFNRQIVESNQEILKLAKKNNFANGMNKFQMEAFAKATGKGVDELLSMLQAEKQWNDAKNSDDPKMRARVARAEALQASDNAFLKDSAKQLELEVMRRSNQDQLTAISQKWSQIMAKLGEVFLPIIDKVLGFVADNLETIVGLSAGIWGVWKLIRFDAFAFGQKIGGIFARFGGAISEVSGFFGGLISKFGGLLKVVGRIAIPLMFAWNIFKEIQKILGDKKLMGTEGFLAFNLKLIPRALGAIIRALWTTINDLFLGLPGMIANGLASAGSYIFGAIMDPFKKAWDWLGKTFLGKSPSELGLRIVEGISSVAGMIFDALSKPFRMFLAWVVDKIPFISKYSEKIRGGFTGGGAVEAKATAAYMPAATITPTGVTVAGNPAKPAAGAATEAYPEVDLMTETTGKSLLGAIMGLRDDLNAGKIAVYMDTQLVSATIARQTEFRGGFGTNNVK